MKTCRVCGEAKPLNEFRTGHNRCKPCTAIYRREYRLKNLERETENERHWYTQNREYKIAYALQRVAENRDEILDRRRAWYEANRASERERDYRRYWENPDARREASSRWIREHPEVNVAKSHQRRVLLRDADRTDMGATVTYITVLRSDPCAYCGESAGTIDHVVPLSKGGSGGWDNLTASCCRCNPSKHATSLLKFLLKTA